jgi:A/G-specific adenine glycosylase
MAGGHAPRRPERLLPTSVEHTSTEPSSDEPFVDEHETVMAWGRANLRALPWRSTRDRWAVLVCEVMAQQTGVGRVVPKWMELCGRWPTPGAFAEADLAEVLRLWSGLGYPRRARNLHLAAQRIVDEHGGRVPGELASLLALPGVGPYTARAVLAFADEERIGVVDTNVARVLSRRVGRRLRPAEAQSQADAWVDRSDPWTWNQSLMEVGALCCRPVPRCDLCPLAAACVWHQGGGLDPDPAVGSAGVSRPQASFAGSDRQARGRLLAAVLDAAVEPGAVASAAGLVDDPERARRLAADLCRDGLVVVTADGSLLAP